MNLSYTYLLLDFLSILFPVLLSFDKKVAFYKSWKYLFPSILLTGIFFIIWDIIFTANGVWGFNPKYIIGFYIFNLPIEEVLFFLCVPYSCVFIYAVLSSYFERDIIKHPKIISIILSILTFLLAILYYDKLYTLVNAGVCSILIVLTTFIYKFKYLGKFYLAYIVSLIPFLICNGILTSLPIVSYNDHENMASRIFTIPFEDLFYCLSLLLSNVFLMEYFKQYKTSKDVNS